MTVPTGVVPQANIEPKTHKVCATEAGPKIEYTRVDKWVAGILTGQLLIALIGGLWMILDVWARKFFLLNLVGYAVPTDEATLRVFQLLLYGMAGGWSEMAQSCIGAWFFQERLMQENVLI